MPCHSNLTLRPTTPASGQKLSLGITREFSVILLGYSYCGAPGNHLTIALAFLYPFSDCKLPDTMHTIQNSSLLPIIFCIVLMPSFKNFSGYMLQRGNPFLFSSAVKDFFFLYYHPVVFRNFKEREELGSSSQHVVCINSYVTLSMGHPISFIGCACF